MWGVCARIENTPRFVQCVISGAGGSPFQYQNRLSFSSISDGSALAGSRATFAARLRLTPGSSFIFSPPARDRPCGDSGEAVRATRGDGGAVSWHGYARAISLLFPLRLLSAQHVAPSVENIAAPFNGAIRAGDSLFAISCNVFACPRHYTVGPAIMENSGLRWVKVDHWSQGRWRIRHC